MLPAPGRARAGTAPMLNSRRTLLPIVITAMLLGACSGPVTRTAAPEMGPQVRVGLLVDSASVVLSSSTGLEIVDPDRGERIAAGEHVVVWADSLGDLRIAGNDTREGLRRVTARPAGDGQLSIGGKAYRGSAVVQSNGPGRLTAINQVDMETYLLGVVPREIGNVGEELLETAKAQAVAARTYAVRYLGRRADLGFDVFATVQDQVYGGVEAEHGPVSRAVRETAGEILTFEGEPIQAFYSSTCAGHTASIHEVWPVESPRPYLTSISDIDPASGEAFCRSSNRFEWTERWSIPEFSEILGRTLADSLPAGTPSVGDLRDLWVLERTPEGRIDAVAIATTVDTFVVGGDRIRWIFLRPSGPILNSSKFDAAVMRDADGRPKEVVVTGGGWGHGIGMCQVGAMGRARAGQDYRRILDAYYQGTSIRRLY